MPGSSFKISSYPSLPQLLSFSTPWCIWQWGCVCLVVRSWWSYKTCSAFFWWASRWWRVGPVPAHAARATYRWILHIYIIPSVVSHFPSAFPSGKVPPFPGYLQEKPVGRHWRRSRWPDVSASTSCGWARVGGAWSKNYGEIIVHRLIATRGAWGSSKPLHLAVGSSLFPSGRQGSALRNHPVGWGWRHGNFALLLSRGRLQSLGSWLSRRLLCVRRRGSWGGCWLVGSNSSVSYMPLGATHSRWLGHCWSTMRYRSSWSSPGWPYCANRLLVALSMPASGMSCCCVSSGVRGGLGKG